MPVTPPIRPKIVIPYPGAEPEYCGLGPLSRKDYEAPRIDISRVASPTRIGVLVGGAPPVGHAAAFNWHDVNGVDWMTPVKNQGYHGTCWAFGPTAVIEACINIAENNPNFDLNLSEEHMTSNCCVYCNVCDTGWGWSSEALRFIRTNGICDEACYPYVGNICPPCNVCAGWESHSCQSTPYINESVDSFKTALETYGPLVVTMEHDEDWMHEGDGGSGLATHCVVLCGWQDDASIPGGGYWILKNSHGTGFHDPGEDPGYGRIRYGVLERHNYAQAVRNPSYPNPAVPCEDHTTQAACEIAGCYWYGDACHSDPEPPPPPCEDHTTQAACETAGCYWYGDACHSDPDPEQFGVIESYTYPEYASPGDAVRIQSITRNDSSNTEAYYIIVQIGTGGYGQRFTLAPGETKYNDILAKGGMPDHDWDLRLELWREE